MTHRPGFSTVSSTSKELLSSRQVGRLVTLGLRCEVFTLIGINNNCKWLHIFSALICYQINSSQTKEKPFDFRVFWILELWMRDCGPVSKYAYILFPAQMETQCRVPCLIHSYYLSAVPHQHKESPQFLFTVA